VRRVTFLRFRCKLATVRRRLFAKSFSVKAVLLVLLALQLVLGLQLQAAQGATMPMSLKTTSMLHAAAQPDCPTHSAHDAMHGVRASVDPSGTSEHTFEHAPPGKHAPMGAHDGTHDCCQASACQCHCVYTPGSIALPALANIATSVAIPSLANAQFVAPCIDEFLRPPIA
jgi:hypothetical protein